MVVEVLRSQLHTFVSRGHRDPDRQERVATQFEEVVARRNRLDAQTLRPDPLQRRLHLQPGVRDASGLAIRRLRFGH